MLNSTLSERQLYHCRACGAWFGATQGTPLHRLRTPIAEIACGLLVVMRRGSLRVAQEVTGHKYLTIGHWLWLAARHAGALTVVLIHDLALSTVEIDEFWSFVRKRESASGPPTTPRRSAH